MVTAQWSTEDEKGKVKKIKEKYLIKATSPTDAEVIVTKEFEGSNIVFRIVDMKELNFVRVVVPDGVDMND